MNARSLVVFLALPLALMLSDAQAAPGLVQPKQKPAPKSKGFPGPKPSSKAFPAPKQEPAPKAKAKGFPGPKPSSKALPVPKQIRPISNVSPKLDPKLAKALRQPKDLTKQQVAAIAGKFSIPANANDVLQPTVLTVRRPYGGPGAYLNFPFADAVRIDAYPDGLASISDKGRMRRVRGTGPAVVPSTTQEELRRQHDPLNSDFPDDADVTIDGSYAVVHFVAAPNRDYVVSCRVSNDNVFGRWVSGTRTYGARIEVGGTYSHVIRGLPLSQGRVSIAIPRATSKRGIDIQLVSYRALDASAGFGFAGLLAGMNMLLPFSISRCNITPIA